LVATLHRAVALEEVDTSPDASARSCTSMWRALGTACSTKTVASPKAEAASRIAVSASSSEARRLDAAKPSATAACRGLDEEREADRLGVGDELAAAIVDPGPVRSVGRPAARRGLERSNLVAGEVQHRRGRPDEGDPRLAQASARSGFSDRKP
jgi:hypothetical protein